MERGGEGNGEGEAVDEVTGVKGGRIYRALKATTKTFLAFPSTYMWGVTGGALFFFYLFHYEL